MEPRTFLNSHRVITADASTIINLNASGCAQRIVRALKSKFVVVDVVQSELEDGRKNGRRDADLLNGLVADGVFEVVRLDGIAMQHFERLVVGPAIETLDDGEAATIAYALSNDVSAAIDERKATSICTTRFPQLTLCSTVDILSMPEVELALGREGLANAAFQSLFHGRMQVPPRCIEWITNLIGPNQAAICRSLPKAARKTLHHRQNSRR
jgi:predicted nucleic acid-binding protein